MPKRDESPEQYSQNETSAPGDSGVDSDHAPGSGRTYTEAELNERVAAAVKFVNECNARQFEIIQQLRRELERSTT